MKVKNVCCLATALILGACGSAQNKKSVSAPSTLDQIPTQVKVYDSQPLAMVLKASAFRMSGDYADHVAVTFDGAGNLVYYPAPTDLTSSSVPVEIGNGWWLNRQGLGPNSVFTKWTFAEYRALKAVPSVEEIKNAVIPGACVTEFEKLPVSASSANNEDPKSLLQYLP